MLNYALTVFTERDAVQLDLGLSYFKKNLSNINITLDNC